MSEEHAVVFVGWLVHATGVPDAGPVKQTSLIMLRLAFATSLDAEMRTAVSEYVPVDV